MRYLAVIQLGASSDFQRIAADAPKIIDAVARLSGSRPEVAFRSPEGQVFGLLFQSERDPTALQGIISSSTYFTNADGMFIVEVGNLKAGSGLSRAWTWLQRHP